MRGKLPVTEAQREQLWEENKVYELRQKLNEGKPTFVLHDGPPYVFAVPPGFKTLKLKFPHVIR